MQTLLWVVIAVLLVVISVLIVKIYLMRKSADEIKEAFSDRLTADTNTLIDISSRDRHMRQLAADINIQLKKLREQQQRFLLGDTELKNAVTNISHDLRTPLTAICGYLDLLEQEEKSEQVENYLKIIENRIENLKQLTEELFRYSVIVATNDDLQLEPVEINGILEESIAAFYQALNERGIDPLINIPESKVVCNADRSALTRIFSNLLNNAIKYSDGDLTITLSESGEITFSNKAHLLDKVQTEKLFDRFYTVETARKSTGLGLSIARTLVEQMGGTITADYTDDVLSICVKLKLI
ncbi:MAG: HAMP domain-containing histidine kinase [Faecalibacterium sp.]|nr:HAMP domain-containing histidine kinase [Ruminococcus sp.]MCM1391290.1 HAMP domain-containing histidine kinase [Ruminococcus sp.]MCM1484736.1 HAMP domain-containing histidine kinase [Faecalibacterium sp.]